MQENNNIIRELSNPDITNKYITEAILITSSDKYFTILEANQPYFDLTGYSREEIWDIYQNRSLSTIHPDDFITALLSLQEQLMDDPSGVFSIDTRLVHKEDNYHSIHLSGRSFTNENGELCYFMLMADTTEQANILNRFVREKSFNDLIDSLTDDSFFDYDVTLREIRFSKHFAKKFEIEEVTQNFPESLLEAGVFKSNFVDYDKFYQNRKQDVHKDRVTLSSPEGNEFVFDLFYKVEFDSDFNPTRIFGKMNDVTYQNEQLGKLIEKAEKDQLTGLYNKATTEFLITDALQSCDSGSKYALMIVDVDNFKSVNDILGHLFGDIVLVQLSDHLKNLFRADDVLGRIGGDEFFVFLRNYSSLDLITTKAQKICQHFNKTYVENDNSVAISASIGIALAPEHGGDFETLYKNADLALYSSKEKGKNQFTIYANQQKASYKSTRTEISPELTMRKSFKENRIEYIFKVLFEAEDQSNAVHRALQLITDHFSFSRSYMCEVDPSGESVSNIFEYTTEEMENDGEAFRNVPISLIQTIIYDLNEYGMFDLSNGEKLTDFEAQYVEDKELQTLLIFAVLDKDHLIGYIGFDSVRQVSLTPEEMEILTTISNILSTFYIKERALAQIKTQEILLSEVLENSKTITYVVDSQNYEILYEADAIINHIGKKSLGKKCYESYRNRTEPCENCVLLEVSDDNPKYLKPRLAEINGKDYSLSASLMPWAKNKAACVINLSEVQESSGLVRIQ